MSDVGVFIKNVFAWGLWLLVRGLMKPTFLILLALTYDGYTTPRFSFSKFNRMLVGDTSEVGTNLANGKILRSKKH